MALWRGIAARLWLRVAPPGSSEVGVVGRGCTPGGIQAVRKRPAARTGAAYIRSRSQETIKGLSEGEGNRGSLVAEGGHSGNPENPTLKRVLRTARVRSPAFRLGSRASLAGNRGLSRCQRNGPFFRDAQEIHMRRPTIREIPKAMGALNITAMGQNGSK